MKKFLPILGLGSVAVLLMMLFINAETTDSDAGQEPDKSISPYYEIRAVKMPEHLEFAGEMAPIKDEDIRERIDRELHVNTYWQSNTLLYFKRANKVFPIIEPILAREGIPDDFKYLAVIESGLINVTSPAGAKGVWQIMPRTARELGLEVNDNVDERYHLEKATIAACQYLKEAKAKFGTWTLAAASYNAGLNGISKRLEQQLADNYYDLLLINETARYVPRILAVKEIMTNPQKYGFYFSPADLYTMPPHYEIVVDTTITDLAGFAKSYNMSYKDLKFLNPWMREGELQDESRKKYHIKIMY